MKFNRFASFTFFLSASIASAFSNNIQLRDEVAIRDKPYAYSPGQNVRNEEREYTSAPRLAVRSKYNVESLAGRGAYRHVLPGARESRISRRYANERRSQRSRLARRDVISDAKKEALSYLQAINTGNLSGSWGSNWADLHGDNKSSAGGKFVCQVRKVGDKYEARVRAHTKFGQFKEGYIFGETTVDGCIKDNKPSAPSFGRAVHFLRTHFGGPAKPACR
ncbi:unnamed protein product [Clonostachys solani]|uniref:Uncharacterized protein n=1 Tax=Clonostachys solani TaxID=160281 RepID=A0A9N9Z8K3_9HYPO|nr:unnamed protein product [Clonostachys solani]